MCSRERERIDGRARVLTRPSQPAGTPPGARSARRPEKPGRLPWRAACTGRREEGEAGGRARAEAERKSGRAGRRRPSLSLARREKRMSAVWSPAPPGDEPGSPLSPTDTGISRSRTYTTELEEEQVSIRCVAPARSGRRRVNVSARARPLPTSSLSLPPFPARSRPLPPPHLCARSVSLAPTRPAWPATVSFEGKRDKKKARLKTPSSDSSPFPSPFSLQSPASSSTPASASSPATSPPTAAGASGSSRSGRRPAAPRPAGPPARPASTGAVCPRQPARGAAPSRRAA